jgi:Flp pilus assembly protein TadG
MRMQNLAVLVSGFKDDRRGAVAIIFALMLVPLLALIGFAVDF